MWLGELITQRGIGNGMSLLIFASVVAGLPAQGAAIKADGGWIAVIVVLARLVLILVAIVFVEPGQRRIPVQFAKRVVGRRMYGGQSTYIPLKVNQSGVIPIIFASSVLYLPLLLSVVLPVRRLGRQRAATGSTTTWSTPNSPFYMIVLRPADHLLRVLLHGDHLRPGAAGRHHPQAGRLHPRHPSRAPDRALPRQGAQPHHAARRAVPRRRRPDPVAPAHVLPAGHASSRSPARRSSSPWVSRSRR